MMYQDIYNCICHNTKNEDILSSMSNLQPNWCLKVDFQKVDQHAGGKWLIHDTKCHKDNRCKAWNSPAEYPSWVARCDIKGSDGTMLNPIFWKKVTVCCHWALNFSEVALSSYFVRTRVHFPNHLIDSNVNELTKFGKSLSHLKLENKKHYSVPNDAIYSDRDLGQRWLR